MLKLQEAGVNGGAPTPVASAPDFTGASFSGTYGDFSVQIFGGASHNGANASDVLSATTRVTNLSASTATLNLIVFQDNFTLPAGSPLSVESGLGGSVNAGTLNLSNIFQAFASSTNNTTFDFTKGPQTALPNGSSFQTGSVTGLFGRLVGSPYALESVVTLNMSAGDDVNFAGHINVTPTPQIDIQKTTDGTPNGNGTDSDFDNEDGASGVGVPVLTPGTAATWTYKVTNTGTVTIPKADVTVTDSIPGVTPVFQPGQGTDDGDNFLAPGEVWIYIATGPVLNLGAPVPQGTTIVQGCGAVTTGGVTRNTYENNGTVTIPGATDSDLSHYCNPVPGSISGTKMIATQAPNLSGRMTGGGSIFTTTGDKGDLLVTGANGSTLDNRITHGFEIHCDPLNTPNNLEINWHGQTQEDNFHLTSLTKAICLDSDLQQKPPAAPFDTYIGVGTGRLNGVDGYSINWTFTDAGESGKDDTAKYLIWKDDGAGGGTPGDGIPNGGEQIALSISPKNITSLGTQIAQFLTFGNHQAHAENKSSSSGSGITTLMPGSGFTIHLFQVDGSGNEILGTDHSTVTGPTGNYSFSNLALANNYQLCEEAPPDFVEINPTIGPSCLTVRSGGPHPVDVPGNFMEAVGISVSLTAAQPNVTVPPADFSNGTGDFVNEQQTTPDGRMTGGGSIFTQPGDIMNGNPVAAGIRITHGFEIHCNPDIDPQHVEVNWIDPASKESHFHLLDMNAPTHCTDTAIIQAPPDAPIDTYFGFGVGRFSGFAGGQQFKNDTGFAINFIFTDGGPTKGEPGIFDTAKYFIFQDNGAGGGIAGDGIRNGSELIVLQSGPTVLTFGNHQAHFENKKAPNVTLNKINQQIDNTFAALDGTDQTKPTILALDNQLLGLFDQMYAVETNSPPGLAGYVYVDDNNNGAKDSGEKPLAGVTLSLTRTDITGQGQTNYGTTTTGANGYYAFGSLPTGSTWKIIETSPLGYLDGKDTPGTLGGTVGNDVISNIVVNGTDGLNYNFGERTPAAISGSVYKDTDDDGLLDSGEPGISGASVTITGTASINGLTVTKTGTTDSNGSYVFTGLEPGTYKVTVAQPSGTTDGSDAVGTVNGVVDGSLSGTYIINVLLKGGDSGVNYNFGELSVYQGLVATIGFWHNAKGQALIKSFGNTSSGVSLANTLATNLPNLFGKFAPAFNVASKVGTNLTNRSNADVANYFLSLYGTNGQNAYAQVLATALSVFASTNSLNTGTNNRTVATSYGFTLSNTGAGVATYTVPSVDWQAFNLDSKSATQSINNLTLLANKNASKGIINGGNATQLGQTTDVFSNINNLGNIGVGLTQVVVGSSNATIAPLGRVYAGTYYVSVDGLDTAHATEERARIHDAIGQINATLGAFGVKLVELGSNSTTTADLQIHLRSTSSIGGVAQGVLGYAELGGQITIINGWDWYFGSAPRAVGRNQYDFQTVVTHELLHGVGLGESNNSNSVMYAYLGTGQVHRQLTAPDLASIAQQAKAVALANALARDLIFAQIGTQPAAPPNPTVKKGLKSSYK